MGSELQSFKEARKALGLTQWEVAEKAGRSVGMVSMVENGLKPSTQTGERLAAVLDRAPGEFWEGM